MANRTLSFILREMGSVLDKLIELAGRKADVVCANDTEGLDEIVRAEDQAARDLAALKRNEPVSLRKKQRAMPVRSRNSVLLFAGKRRDSGF